MHNYAVEVGTRWGKSSGVVDVTENIEVFSSNQFNYLIQQGMREISFTLIITLRFTTLKNSNSFNSMQKAIGNVVWKLTFGIDLDFDNELLLKYRKLQVDVSEPSLFHFP